MSDHRSYTSRVNAAYELAQSRNRPCLRAAIRKTIRVVLNMRNGATFQTFTHGAV